MLDINKVNIVNTIGSDIKDYKQSGIFDFYIEDNKVVICNYAEYKYIYKEEWIIIGFYKMDDKEGRIFLEGMKEYKWYKNLGSIVNAVLKSNNNMGMFTTKEQILKAYEDAKNNNKNEVIETQEEQNTIYKEIVNHEVIGGVEMVKMSQEEIEQVRNKTISNIYKWINTQFITIEKGKELLNEMGLELDYNKITIEIEKEEGNKMDLQNMNAINEVSKNHYLFINWFKGIQATIIINDNKEIIDLSGKGAKNFKEYIEKYFYNFLNENTNNSIKTKQEMKEKIEFEECNNIKTKSACKINNYKKNKEITVLVGNDENIYICKKGNYDNNGYCKQGYKVSSNIKVYGLLIYGYTENDKLQLFNKEYIKECENILKFIKQIA